MAAEEEPEARVTRLRREIRRVDDEALSCADATEEIWKRSQIVKLWAAIVSETNDAADKEQLYHAHLALWGMAGVTEAQRAASRSFCALYEDTVRAQLPGYVPNGSRLYARRLTSSGALLTDATSSQAAATRASDAVRCIKEPADFV
eukprot:CAMPEP_0118896062 /NCGR_PEP_ID=MMETSP1166-20130328/4116_1 /TAXON_ID=1104430 /ORGANISM="Chrysoreinhardia sp, Strain CCMP3193" /LENGTH=146 /DNA_ID=CAMNT_0006835113 /DNA_START=26 /DNA_END=462 /DNA_ORIENTATION=+